MEANEELFHLIKRRTRFKNDIIHLLALIEVQTVRPSLFEPLCRTAKREREEGGGAWLVAALLEQKRVGTAAFLTVTPSQIWNVLGI